MINTAQSLTRRKARLLLALPERRLWIAGPFRRCAAFFSGRRVDLRTDLYADENGKAIHEDGYVKHIISNGYHSKSGGEEVR